MILANFFTVLKYGANIILAVLGFISFEDLNQKSSRNFDQNISVVEHVNFVEELRMDEQTASKKMYYADNFYFTNEKNLPQSQPTNQINYAMEKEEEPVFQLETRSELSDNYFIVDQGKDKDFEILILNDSTEFEYCIKIVDEKENNNSTYIVKNALLISIPISVE